MESESERLKAAEYQTHKGERNLENQVLRITTLHNVIFTQSIESSTSLGGLGQDGTF